MKQRNCKNCGSALEHSYNHKCPYCGTLYDFNADDNLKIKFDDIVDVEFRECQYDFIDNSLILYFKGVQIERPKMYEIEDDYQISATTFNPKKCYCAIKVDIGELRQYKMNYFMHLLYEHFHYLRDSERKNIINQIFNDRAFIRQLYQSGMHINDNMIC